MKTIYNWSVVAAALVLLPGWIQPANGAEQAPFISTLTKPAAGPLEIVFHGTNGPFLIQTRPSVDAQWVDVPNSVITEVQPGVLIGQVPSPETPLDLSFFRVVSEGDPTAQINAWTVLLRVSAPTNGVYFVQGESPVVTVTILDTMGQAIGKADFSTLSLYMYGPQDPQQTVTASKLLNATTDRSKNPNHSIDLRSNAGVQADGRTLTYALQPVTDEKAGTYTVSLYAVLASDPLQQMMKFANVQIETKEVESPVVTKAQCASCHEGPISGKVYMHHIDPSGSSRGSWARDFEPVTSCKSCHNNDGSAAFTDASGAKAPDPIIRRVHGIHMGEGLSLPFNTNSTTGNFRDYTHVEFPADVRDCTKCHADNRWQTQPSRLACGSCHDSIWFGARDQVPAGMKMHGPGPQPDDSMCAFCHTVDPFGLKPIAVSHQIPTPPLNAVDVSLSPPANGTFYVPGEKPVVSIIFKNDVTNSIGDHGVVDAAHFSAASLFVYGPRSLTAPVLTSTARLGVGVARASVTCGKDGPWDINGKILKIGINGSPAQDIKIVGASGAVTAAEVVASLNPVITNLNGGAQASVSGAKVNIKTLIRGPNARIEIYNGDVTTAMAWKASGVVLDPDVTVAQSSTAANDLRPVTDPLEFNDPQVTRTATNIVYQLDDVAGLTPGTYCAFVYYVPKPGKIAGLANAAGIGLAKFQIGTATIEKKIAGNCTDCHGDQIFHLYEAHVHPARFDVDYCKACHDYGHPGTGDMFKNQGGTSLNGWSGYGAMPISHRVHGVHYGHYLDHPEEVYANATPDTFGNIIFPQDVRNCTKCHAESDTWKQNPSRIACLGCHDTDAAKTHAKLMTYIPDPSDPYGPSAQETCEVCHGGDAEFSPDKVHRISNPYVPPYPRDPKE